MTVMAGQISMKQTDAAKALGVTDRTLRTWTRDGKFFPVKRGGVLLYPVEELRRFVKLNGSDGR